MPITLGSNISSLRGQRQLSRTSAELGTVFERLSSGQRINKASDDAAGLSIADSLNAKGRVFNQGVRNLNDGLSLLSIADSAIETLSGIMIRLEELAEQAANGVYSTQQRKALDGEAQALAKEFFRVSKTTEFNGQKLLTGELDTVNLQAGVGSIAVLSAGVGGAIGTGSFGSTNQYSTGSGINRVATGDLNGDGTLDLVTSDSTNGTVSVLLGQGNGSFAAARQFSVGATPYSVSLGDLNNDGLLDLIASNSLEDTISVLLGLGDGNFSAAADYSVGDEPYSATTGDFNGDGILDLLTANIIDQNVSVLLGLGDGTFSAALSSAAGNGGPISVTTGDFDGDGMLDVAVANYYGQSTNILLGKGDGSFNGPTSYGTLERVLFVKSGDLNGDGILDLVASRYDGNVGVRLGVGDGSFGSEVDYSPALAIVSSVDLGDFNGDGVLDLVAANFSKSTVSVLLGRGNGGFEAATEFFAGSGPNSVITNDFNNDGVLDVAAANGGTVRILLGESVAGVGPLVPFSLQTLADARQALPVFKRKREQLAAQRGQIGAFQSRIAVARNVLEVSSENFRAAESRIRDADIADESSRLVRLNILQQAASSVLAQANQQPALALQLLRA